MIATKHTRPLLLAVIFSVTLGVTLPGSSSAAPGFSKSSAKRVAKVAMKSNAETRRILKGPKCRLPSRSRATCSVRWTDGLRKFAGTVKLRRADPAGSPVDSYRVSGTGRAKYLKSERYRNSGRVVVPTRRSSFGFPLRLLGQSPESDVTVTPVRFVEPFVPASDFDAPLAGRHFVRVDLELLNMARPNYSDSINNSSTLIMSDGLSYTNDYVGDCNGSVDVPFGDVRADCVVFSVPNGQVVREFAFKLDSGFGDELGVWR